MTMIRNVFESVTGAGAMINWISVAREDLPIYEDWYNFQHLPERVSTPGFLRARRFVAADQAQLGEAAMVDYLTLYETVDVHVLASPEYLRRLDNPTDLTLEVVPLFTEFRRAACHITVARGDGSSGRVVVVEAQSGNDLETLRDALAGSVFQELINEHRVVAASLYEPDITVSDAKNSTAEGRSSDQQQALSAVVLIELHSGVDADALIADLAHRATRAGARFDQSRPARIFELIYELRSATTSYPSAEAPCE
ncbi:hypothetical protein M1247_00925 [Mycobacterium sp. 21AC1]|uniref:hypothetical protein n=1 Tax=[Mycobacterium] appelbergii TaxID=2939269 RepID=UPI0029394E42|nr:hypothetical protein [Mycobacterium sp. 21AC1]MDV3123464.1 hypothetical protein [Mycobacterium sp. 21AC1]